MTRLFDQQSFGSGGAYFWIGQVVDDSTWRDNVNPKLHEDPADIKGWGYRYKVRIFGNQTKIKTDDEVPDELLATAEVLYPVTAGSGQAGCRQTPNLRQGNFVLGYYKDGLDSQQPVIIGAIATNDNIVLEGADPEEGFMARTGTDGLSGPIQVAAKDQLLSPNGSDKPVREGTSVSIAAVSDPMQAFAGNETTALKVADKNKENELDTVQIIIKNLLAVINRVRASSASFFGASTAPTRIIKSEINKVINLVASFIKSLIQKIRGTVITALNNAVKDFVYFLFPNQRGVLEEIQVQATDTIGCVFNKIIDGLITLVKGFLEEFIQNNVNAPLCAVEGAVGKLLNNGLVDVADALSSVLGPIQGVFAGIGGAANIGGGLSVGGIIDQIAAVLQFLSCDETQQHPKIKEWSPWAGIKATTPLSSPLSNLIAGVNLGGAAPACNTGPSLAGPPALVAIGGNALIDAVFNPIVSATGEIIAVDIVNPGVGYQAAPTIVVTATNDQGVIGGGAVLQPVVQNGAVTDVVVKESGSGFLPASNGTTVGAGNVVFSTPGQTVVFSKPPGPRIPGGTTLNSSFSVPRGASIPSGTIIPSGTTLPTDLILSEGSGGTPVVLEGTAGLRLLAGGVGGDAVNLNGQPAFLGGSGTPISGGLSGIFNSLNGELVLDPETGERISAENRSGSTLRLGRTLQPRRDPEDAVLTVTTNPDLEGVLKVIPRFGVSSFDSSNEDFERTVRLSTRTVSFNGNQLSSFGFDVRVQASNTNRLSDASGNSRLFVGGTGLPFLINGKPVTINGFPVTTGVGDERTTREPIILAAERGPNIKGIPVFFDDIPPGTNDETIKVSIGGDGGVPVTVGATGGSPVTCEGLPLAVGQRGGIPILTLLGNADTRKALEQGNLKSSSVTLVSAGGAPVTIGGEGGIPVVAGGTGGVPVIAEAVAPDGGFIATVFDENIDKQGTPLRAGATGGLPARILRVSPLSGLGGFGGRLGAGGESEGKLASVLLNFGQPRNIGGDGSSFGNAGSDIVAGVAPVTLKENTPTSISQVTRPRPTVNSIEEAPAISEDVVSSGTELRSGSTGGTPVLVDSVPLTADGVPINAGGTGGTLVSSGGSGGTPVTIGGVPVTDSNGVPVTAGGTGGTPVTAGGTGGTNATSNNTPINSSAGPLRIGASVSASTTPTTTRPRRSNAIRRRSTQNTITVGGSGGTRLTVGGTGGRPATINGSPLSVGGQGGTILTVGGPGGTPVTVGRLPVTLGAVGGTPINVGATGGTPVTADRQSVTVGATGGTPISSATRTNSRKNVAVPTIPTINPETGEFEVTDETPITVGGTGGLPLTVGSDGGDPVSINRSPITVGGSGGRVLSSGGATLAVARKEVFLTEGTTLTEDLVVSFDNTIPEGSIISSGTTIPFDIELTTILDLPKQLIDAIQAEPFSNSLEAGDVEGLLEFGYTAYSPNKTVRVKPGDQISAPFGTTSEIVDNLGNVIDTIIGKGQTVPITVKSFGNYTTPKPITETTDFSGLSITAGGTGGTPVTIGGVPLTDSNGVPVTVGGTGGVPLTDSNGIPVIVGGTGGAPVTDSNGVPVTVSGTGGTLVTDSNGVPVTVGGTGGTPVTTGGVPVTDSNGVPVTVG